MSQDDLSAGEIRMLVDGLSDDVALVWALIHLDIVDRRGNKNFAPTPAEIAEAFASFERLVNGGFMRIGRTETVPGSRPIIWWKGHKGLHPYHVVPDEPTLVRRRVD